MSPLGCSRKKVLTDRFHPIILITVWDAMLYVLEGSVVMQLKGGKEVTLTPGQAFYEGPDDVHVVDRNASSTKPAKFVVFLIKDKGAPALVPVE